MSETEEKKDKNDLKLIGFTVFVLLVVLGWSLWRFQSNSSEDSKRKFDASVEVVKTVATIAGGIVLYLNFRVAKDKLDQETGKAKKEAKLAEARLTMERFSKAVDMMGSDKSIHLRLGGIYALESIVLDSSDDTIDENYRQVLEVLTAFVRENSPYPPRKQVEKELAIPLQLTEQSIVEDNGQEKKIPSLPTDIQAALTILNRRKHKNKDWEQYPLDLRKTDLRRASLGEADLQKAYLTEANLQKAYLWKAKLQEAYLMKANLQEARLGEANLQEANLGEANLQEAYLVKAQLQEADLSGTKLQKATLWEANLQKAYLTEANLQKAYFWKAKLQEADLTEANLQEADLTEANLQKANLTGANLQKADLTGAKLQKADLTGAKLQEANLEEANLQEANLEEAKLQDGILLLTDLRKAKNLDQILEGEQPPLLCNVALSEGFPDKDKLRDRDCDKMPAELHKRYPGRFESLEAAKQFVDEQRQKKWE